MIHLIVIALLTLMAPALAIYLALDAVSDATVRKSMRAGFSRIGDK